MATYKKFVDYFSSKCTIPKDSRDTLGYVSLIDDYTQESSRVTRLPQTHPHLAMTYHPMPVSFMSLGFIHTRGPGISEFCFWHPEG